MNTQVSIDTTRQPVVHAKDGEVFASSRDVAALFGKEHRNVMRDIDNRLAQEAKLGLLNFEQGYYTLVSTGEQLHRMC